MVYKIKGVHNRHFELFDENDNPAGRLDYINLLSSKADITLANGNVYHIAHAGIFGISIEIEHNDNVIGTLKFNWKSQVIINFGDSETYVFKGKGFWHHHYVLLDGAGNELAIIHPDFEWSKMSHDYEIEMNPAHQDKAKNILLPLILTFCANLAISTGASGAI